MNGWRVTFKYDQGGNRIDLELEGSEQAIHAGLGLAAAMIGPRLKQLAAGGNVPPALRAEASVLGLLLQGAQIAPYAGQFLQIAPVAKAPGLVSSLSVAWAD